MRDRSAPCSENQTKTAGTRGLAFGSPDSGAGRRNRSRDRQSDFRNQQSRARRQRNRPSPEPRRGRAATSFDGPPTDHRNRGRGGRQSTRKPNCRRLAIAGVLLLAAIGAAGMFGYHWWTVGRFTVSTDDAYVRAHNTTLPPRFPDTSPTCWSKTTRMYAPANSLPRSMMATIGWRSMLRTTKSRPSRQPSTVSAVRSKRSSLRSSRRRRNSSPRRLPPSARNLSWTASRLWRNANSPAARLSTSAGELRSGYRRRAERAGRARGAQAALRSCRRSSRRPCASSRNCRPRWPRPSAISRSPKSARRSAACRQPRLQTGDFVQTGQRLASLVRSTTSISSEFQGDASRASAPPEGRHQRRCDSRTCHRRHRRELFAASGACSRCCRR